MKNTTNYKFLSSKIVVNVFIRFTSLCKKYNKTISSFLRKLWLMFILGLPVCEKNTIKDEFLSSKILVNVYIRFTSL